MLRPAPLLFAGDSIFVPVHLYAGTVGEEVLGFGTGTHLGAVLSSVAFKAAGCAGWRNRDFGPSSFRVESNTDNSWS